MLSSEFYLSQVDQFNQQEEQVGRKSKWLSSVRAILFLFWLVVFLVLVNYREMQWAFIVSAVFIISFSVVLKIHNKIKFKRRQLQNLIRINELELERQHGNFKTLENARVVAERGAARERGRESRTRARGRGRPDARAG